MNRIANMLRQRVLRALALFLVFAVQAGAPPGDNPPVKLKVATKEAAPFAMKSADGQWTGMSIDLWRDLARELELQYEFVESQDLKTMLAKVASGEADAAVAAITVTPERQAVMDFTHPYFHAGFGLGHPGAGGGSLAAIFRSVFSKQFLTAVVALVVILLVAALAVWLFERKANATQFGGNLAQGLGASFWWSAVTMTTVGYGDKAPQTLGGRAVALIWMFTSVIVISGFTAGIASAITVKSLSVDLLKSRRLSELRIGTVAGSSAEAHGRNAHWRLSSYEALDAALNGLRAGQIDVVLHDAPLLKHRARQPAYAWLEVSPVSHFEEDYAIALPPGSELRKPLNVAIVERLTGERWAEIRYEYLGE